MTLEEQRLSEMLHRLTPEPPRTVTVEDVAIHLANQGAGKPVRPVRAFGSGGSGGDGHTAVLRIGKRGRARFAPALAAASVLVVVGASAGVAVALTSSHHNTKSPASGGLTSSTASAQSSTPAADDTTPPGDSGTHPPEPRIPVAGGMWGAELIVQQSLDSGTLVGGGNSLYALSNGSLIRIDPSKGQIMAQASVPGSDRPVVDGNEVWVDSPNSGGGVTLSAFNAATLAPAGSVAVPGGVFQPEGALAVGPGGDLYVAAGSSVAVIDPGSHSVIRHIAVSGSADSVAVTPDGSTLYVTAGGTLDTFDTATGERIASSPLGGPTGGYLVATPGGVWGTLGMLMTQRVWFAPGGNMSKAVRITGGVDGALDSVPAYANGTVWVGGTQTLQCLNPSTGKTLASATIPADSGVPEHFGSVAFAGGHVYTTFQDQHAQHVGVAAVTPPSACGTSSSAGS